MFDKLAIDDGKPVREKFLPYGYHLIDQDDIDSVVKALKSDFITQGPKIDEFEKAVARYCQTRYAVAFSSGTAALHAAAYTAGIKSGDEAITTPITFAASGNCVLYLNGKISLADIKKDTYNIDPDQIKKHVTRNTKAIIPVDFTGQPCEIDEINDIAKENNFVVIEDATHALGSYYKGKKIGGLTELAVLSFHPVKHITTGEGGMVLTNDEEHYEKLQQFRTHGITKNPKKMKKKEGQWYYEMQALGFNYRITDFQCALGLSQLKKLDKFIKRRREIVDKYNEALCGIEEIITPYEKQDVKSSYHLYVIQLKLEKLKYNRKKIFEALRAENIGAHVHYIPLHLHPFYQENFGFKKGDYQIAEIYYDRALTLPLFPAMSNDDTDDVINALKKVINNYKI
jgi:UDP-4-amino-4,6-dideoxy-N-acetyl-beta-L-altrosamine transaminase